MRKFLVSFALLQCSICVLAQINGADSLKRLLDKETKDSSKVRLMSQLAHAYLYSKPDTTLLIASQALDLARLSNFKAGEAESLRWMALVFTNTGNYPKALELALQSLK